MWTRIFAHSLVTECMVMQKRIFTAGSTGVTIKFQHSILCLERSATLRRATPYILSLQNAYFWRNRHWPPRVDRSSKLYPKEAFRDIAIEVCDDPKKKKWDLGAY